MSERVLARDVAALLVHRVHITGAFLLWDPKRRVVRIIRGERVSRVLKATLNANLEAVVAYIKAQAELG